MEIITTTERKIPNWFISMVEFFVPPGMDAAEQEYRRTKLVAYTLFITALFALFYISVSIFIHFYTAVWILLLSVAGYFILLYLLRNKMNVYLVANLYGVVGASSVYGCVFFSGGFHSPNIGWLASSPIVILMLAGKRSGYIWAVLALLIVVFTGIMDANGFNFPIMYDPAFSLFLGISSYAGLILIIFVIALVFENVRIRAFDSIRKEKARSDKLLLNILPGEIVNELKESGKTIARSYDMVSVMFVDFVDFTTLSDDQTPESLVSGIDEYFLAFDQIVGNYKVEKIKTVGDAYMCASGLPVTDTRNALEITEAANDILHKVEQLKNKRQAEGNVFYEVRIGIHSGPVVAGVVGSKKFSYDIWGDTVNKAARMQQNGESGKINISETTHALIKHRYKCIYRGRIQAKYKSDIDMYFVDYKL